MYTSGKHDAYPVLEFKDSKAFEKWLKQNHAKSDGVWMKFAKVKSGIKSVNYTQALDVALCYGWIDGLARKFDENYYLQKFTPRRSRSIWSAINKKKVAALIKDGKMQPAGLAAIETAKQNGRWDSAYDSQRNIEIPETFQKELDKSTKAKAFFATLTSVNRYAILYRITTAKKQETKEKRIKEFMEMLKKGETVYPQ